jgi:integrase/recombinase XerD
VWTTKRPLPTLAHSLTTPAPNTVLAESPEPFGPDALRLPRPRPIEYREHAGRPNPLTIPHRAKPIRGDPVRNKSAGELRFSVRPNNRSRPAGQRDYALFALMFNTGARVQELLNLRRRDIRLDPPCQVRLQGKGNKVRLCPIWPATARLLRDLIKTARPSTADPAEAPLFTNARGQPLTRFGVWYLLRKHIAAAGQQVATLRDKCIHPHSVRHSTAIHLLKAGVDFATISHWLGHASPNTTMRYARADLDLKRQALAQVFPEALAPPRAGRLLINGAELIGWLRRI